MDGPIADLKNTHKTADDDSEGEKDNNNNNTEDFNESDYEVVDETDNANVPANTANATNTASSNIRNTPTTPVHNTTDTTHHNADYSTTQSNTMHTTSGIQYKNNNTVNKSGRSKLQEKFFRMSSALCEVVDDFGLVSFHPMNIEDVEVSIMLCATSPVASSLVPVVTCVFYWIKCMFCTNRALLRIIKQTVGRVLAATDNANGFR